MASIFEKLGYRVHQYPAASSGFDFVISKPLFPFDAQVAVDLKFRLRDLVSGATVEEARGVLARHPELDKVAVVTTLGFTVQARKVAASASGKISLLTEAELVQKLPGRSKALYLDGLLAANYLEPYLRDLLGNERVEKGLLDALPRERAIQLAAEYTPPREFSGFIAATVPRDILLREILASVPTKQLEEVLRDVIRDRSPPAADKARIADMYREALRQTDNNRKGKLLEETMKRLFALVPGLEVVASDVNDGMQEVDIQVKNGNGENVWSEFGRMVFIECKNWSSRVGGSEVRDFKVKMEQYGLRAGIMVSVGGFTGDGLEGAWGTIRTCLAQGFNIVTLDGDDLERIFSCTDISEVIDAAYVRLFQRSR